MDEVTERLADLGVKGPIGQKERHDCRFRRDAAYAVRIDGELDRLGGCRTARVHAPPSAEDRDEKKRIERAPGPHRALAVNVESVLAHCFGGDTPQPDESTGPIEVHTRPGGEAALNLVG